MLVEIQYQLLTRFCLFLSIFFQNGTKSSEADMNMEIWNIMLLCRLLGKGKSCNSAERNDSPTGKYNETGPLTSYIHKNLSRQIKNIIANVTIVRF